jgi:hypothetical protein
LCRLLIVDVSECEIWLRYKDSTASLFNGSHQAHNKTVSPILSVLITLTSRSSPRLTVVTLGFVGMSVCHCVASLASERVNHTAVSDVPTIPRAPRLASRDHRSDPHRSWSWSSVCDCKAGILARLCDRSSSMTTCVRRDGVPILFLEREGVPEKAGVGKKSHE